ncbi:MAG: hypothetical protein U1E71_10020 [Ramlibacter sp.]|jgi:hypothetical protein
MTALTDAQRLALLTHAAALLHINDQSRIVIDGSAPDVAELGGRALRIIFEPPGVVRVYERHTGQLLAECEPGQLCKPVRTARTGAP